MSERRGAVQATPRRALQAMGIEPVAVRRVAHDATNDHWRVPTSDGSIFLRRSAPDRAPDAISYELQVIGALATIGWPVPRPVTPPIALDGRVWTAFEARHGRPRRPRSKDGERKEQRTRGRLLGRLHADLAGIASFGQKPGFERAERSFADLDRKLPGLSRTRPDEARALGRHLDETRRALEALRVGDRPAQLIHGDFSTWNLLHSAGQLTGVLDFDLSHVDHRVADFAISWRGVHDEVVRGYDEVNPLSPSDWELLVPVFRAWYLSQASRKFVGQTIPDPQLGFVLNHLNRTPTLAPR